MLKSAPCVGRLPLQGEHRTMAELLNGRKPAYKKYGLQVGYFWATKQNAHFKWAFAFSGDRRLCGCASKI